MRRVEQIMGMPISLDIPGGEEMAFLAAFERLKQIDNRFSTFKSGSEVSRFKAGALQEAQLSPEVSLVINACRRAEAVTDGYFSAWADGSFDPSGYVKGWALAEAGKVIEAKGYPTYCLGAGGDILAKSDSNKVWQIGIQDPHDRGSLLKKVELTTGAIATSGNYERGAHIIDPKTKRPADNLLSVTVQGPDIIWADILATAIFAAGQLEPAFLKSFPEYEALVLA